MDNLPKTGLGGSLIVAGLFLFSGSVMAEDAATPSYSGLVRATYDYRGLGDYSDQDAYGYWTFRGRNLANKRVEIYTSGRLHNDLDGTTTSAYDPFGSIDDGSKSDLRLLQFYVDIHDRAGEKSLRYGRQYVDVADYIQMDGAQVMLFEKEAIGGRVFLGQPVSDYSSVNGDLFMGASLTGKPWKGNRSRATYARYQDDSRDAADDHYFFDMKQRFNDELRARTYLSVMNEDVRMGGADLYYVSLSDYVFDAVLGIRRWGDYSADTRVFSPLTEALGGLEPYTTAYGRFTAEVLPWLYLSPGAMVQEPDDSNATNRRFGRYNLDFIFQPVESFSATIAAEYWDVEVSDHFVGVSGDLRYRYRKLWELSLGAAYVDYSYVQLSDQSVITSENPITHFTDVTPLDGTRVSPDAYTYYLRAKWNLTEKTALRLAGEIEDDSDQPDLGYRFRTSIEVRL